MENHLKYSLRGLKKNAIFSFITVFGLSVAFASCLLILFYVNFEFSHDKFHQNKENIYRIVYTAEGTEEEVYKSALHNYRLAERLKQEVPQIKHASGYRRGYSAIVKYQEHIFDERLFIVEPDFLKIFSFPLLAGNVETAFLAPTDAVITKTLADKIVKDKSIDYVELIGNTIEFLNVPQTVFTIKGILEDIPKTSSLTFDILIGYEYQGYFAQSDNGVGNSSICIELFSDTDPKAAEETAIKVIRTYYEPQILEFQSEGSMAKSPDAFKPRFENITEIYFNQAYNLYESSSSKTNSIILSIIGLIILLIACSNYLLLSFGLTLKKVHHIGIFKVFGASRPQILKVFWFEAVVQTLLGVLIGLLLSYLLFPQFCELAQRVFSINSINQWVIPTFMIAAVFIVTAFISLPLIISFQNVNPSILLKKQTGILRKSWISNSFVVFQYFLAAVLIISTIVLFKQTNLMKTKSLGFNPENIIELSIPADCRDAKTRVLKEQLANLPAIISVTGNDKGFLGNRSTYDVKNSNGENHSIRMLKTDTDYIETMGLTLLDGEDFTVDNINATNEEVIVNEKFISVMNMDRGIGEYFDVTSWQPFRIIGIVKDFHFDSMKDEIQPLIMIPNDRYEKLRYLYIKYPQNNSSEALSVIQKVWDTNLPGREMNYSFLDQLLSSRYMDQERWGKIVGFASFMAILISSLGLFGLTLIIVNKRIREIGIRRVNGASILDVLLLLNKNFLVKIMAAFIVACPVAGIIMHKWLENFAYRISVNIWVYLLAGILLLFIAMLTVNWQCWKAARRNPVEALKYE